VCYWSVIGNVGAARFDVSSEGFKRAPHRQTWRETSRSVRYCHRLATTSTIVWVVAVVLTSRFRIDFGVLK
jgi:hypothetical protein